MDLLLPQYFETIRWICFGVVMAFVLGMLLMFSTQLYTERKWDKRRQRIERNRRRHNV